MPFAIYVARRGLAPGHSAGSTYTVILPSLERLEISREIRIEQQRTLSGATESRYYNGKGIWQVQLEPVYGDQAELVLEFLRSTEDGQIFTFDPEGRPDAQSSLAVSVVRTGQGHTTARGKALGTGGSRDPLAFGFEIREA